MLLMNPELTDPEVHILSPLPWLPEEQELVRYGGGQRSASGQLQDAESPGRSSTVRGCAWGPLHALMRGSSPPKHRLS